MKALYKSGIVNVIGLLTMFQAYSNESYFRSTLISEFGATEGQSITINDHVSSIMASERAAHISGQNMVNSNNYGNNISNNITGNIHSFTSRFKSNRLHAKTPPRDVTRNIYDVPQRLTSPKPITHLNLQPNPYPTTIQRTSTHKRKPLITDTLVNIGRQFNNGALSSAIIPIARTVYQPQTLQHKYRVMSTPKKIKEQRSITRTPKTSQFKPYNEQLVTKKSNSHRNVINSNSKIENKHSKLKIQTMNSNISQYLPVQYDSFCTDTKSTCNVESKLLMKQLGNMCVPIHQSQLSGNEQSGSQQYKSLNKKKTVKHNYTSELSRNYSGTAITSNITYNECNNDTVESAITNCNLTDISTVSQLNNSTLNIKSELESNIDDSECVTAIKKVHTKNTLKSRAAKTKCRKMNKESEINETRKKTSIEKISKKSKSSISVTPEFLADLKEFFEKCNVAEEDKVEMASAHNFTWGRCKPEDM